VKAATFHRSDFVQQNVAKTKTNIFVCACDITCFIFLTKLVKYKAGEQQGERWLLVGPLAPVTLNK